MIGSSESSHSLVYSIPEFSLEALKSLQLAQTPISTSYHD